MMSPTRAGILTSWLTTLLLLVALTAGLGCDRQKLDARRFVNRGVEALERGQGDVAYDFFAQAIALDKSNAAAHYHLGLVYAYERQQPERARERFEEVLRVAPQDSDALYQLGVLARKAGKPKKARDYLARAAKTAKAPAQLAYELALVDEAAGDLSLMDKGLRDAIRHDPAFEPAYYELTSLYAKLNEHERALAVVNEAMQLDPELAALYFLYASLLKQEGRVVEAVGAIEEGLARDPKNEEGFFDLGYFLASLGRYQPAIFHLKQYVKKAQNTNPERVRLAKTLIDKLWVEIEREDAEKDPNLRIF
jgi:tetratricopeptide (TPR) repeat protein